MRTATIAIFAVFTVTLPVLATADDGIIVSASRIETKRSEIGSSVSVYGAEEIERNKETTVIDALRHIPGVDIVQSGPLGGNAVAFIRGANSEHTLILVDGIELNNPATPNRAFNLANLTLDNVERIEVIRGPQSTVHGSDALGGVINIVTKRGMKEPTAHVWAEAGSYDSYIEQAGASGATERLDGSVSVTRKDVGGFSAARGGGDFDDDGYEETAGSLKLGFDPVEEFRMQAVTRFNHSDAELDNSGGINGDDPNRRLKNDEWFSRLEGKTNLLDGALSQVAGFSYSDHAFDDDNDPDTLHPADLLRSEYEGSLAKFDLRNEWRLDEINALVIGVETEEERARSSIFSDGAFGPFEDVLAPVSARTNGYFIEDRLSVGDAATIIGGVRVDDHDRFGTKSTWRITPSFKVPDSGTILRGSVGTGYKAPSLVQLFSSFGTPELDEEKVLGWDLGFEQELGSSVTFEATYFHNDFENLISFDPATFKYENIAEATTHGLETAVRAEVTDDFQISSNYTYTDTEDESTGASLLRRPRNKLVIEASYKPIKALQLSIFSRSVGGRFDNDFETFPPERVRLGGYTTINLTAAYDLTEHVQLFSRVENLFDKEYEEVLGYGTSGLAGFAGVKVSL